MSSARRHLVAGLLLAALLTAGAGLLAQASGVLRGVEQRSVAARFEVRGATTPSDVAVVAIDDATFAELERQWPFPRSLHGQVITALHTAGVREIVYDVQFTEPTTASEDGALYAALARAGGAVLATSESDDDGHTNVLGGDDKLADAHSVAAAANLPDDLGGGLGRFPYASGRLRSLAVAAAARVGGPVPARSRFGSDGAWIDFRGPPGTITTVSFSALIDGRVDPALLRDRIVVVGASAPSLQDVHATPTGSEPMSGAELQANAIWTALHGLPLRDAPTGLEIALVVLLAFAVPLLRLRLRVLPAALSGPLLALVFVGAAQAAFAHGTVTWVTAPLVALAVGTVTMVVASHLSESAARRRVSRDKDILEARVRERTRELRDTQLEILQRLSRAAEWRDGDTGRHLARMGELSYRLASAVGLPPEEAERLGSAAVVHDIGKIAVPDRILRKAGPLTDAEREAMERHPLIGASMLSGSRSPVMQLAEVVARTHHEHWDGTGYPNAVAGTDIPLAGRICALCDVFDALVSERPYKQAWSLERALQEIQERQGRHFDPDLVATFIAIAPIAYAELYGDGRAPETPGAARAVQPTESRVALVP